MTLHTKLAGFVVLESDPEERNDDAWSDTSKCLAFPWPNTCQIGVAHAVAAANGIRRTTSGKRTYQDRERQLTAFVVHHIIHTELPSEAMLSIPRAYAIKVGTSTLDGRRSMYQKPARRGSDVPRLETNARKAA